MQNYENSKLIDYVYQNDIDQVRYIIMMGIVQEPYFIYKFIEVNNLKIRHFI